MKYLAICRTHGHLNKACWLDDCDDFWHAVEKARFLPRPKEPLPPKPVCHGGHDYLHSSAVHEWQRACTRVHLSNDGRISEVLELKPFMGG